MRTKTQVYNYRGGSCIMEKHDNGITSAFVEIEPGQYTTLKSYNGFSGLRAFIRQAITERKRAIGKDRY